MKLLFLLFFLTFSVSCFSNDNPELAKAEYVGDLTWEYKNFKIKRQNLIKTEKTWIFESVTPIWGGLNISFISSSENEKFEISTKNFDNKEKKSNTISFGKNTNYKPFLFSSPPAFAILKEKKPLIFYLVNWENTKEYDAWKKKITENKLAWDKYDQLSNAEKRATKAPKQKHWLKLNMPTQFHYVVKETFKIIIPETEESENDYWEKVEKMESKARLVKVGYFVLILVVIFVVWFILKMSYRATKTAVSKVGEGCNNLKDKQYKKKVRKLAEVTAMTEIIKEEIKSSTPDELSQLKKQIAEAIESGDNEKADSLLNIAERLKKLND